MGLESCKQTMQTDGGVYCSGPCGVESLDGHARGDLENGRRKLSAKARKEGRVCDAGVDVDGVHKRKITSELDGGSESRESFDEVTTRQRGQRLGQRRDERRSLCRFTRQRWGNR